MSNNSPDDVLEEDDAGLPLNKPRLTIVPPEPTAEEVLELSRKEAHKYHQQHVDALINGTPRPQTLTEYRRQLRKKKLKDMTQKALAATPKVVELAAVTDVSTAVSKATSKARQEDVSGLGLGLDYERRVAAGFKLPESCSVTGPTEIGGVLREEQVDLHRNLLCPRYDKCLEVAVTDRWNGFSCTPCTEFRNRPKVVESAETASNVRKLFTVLVE